MPICLQQSLLSLRDSIGTRSLLPTKVIVFRFFGTIYWINKYIRALTIIVMILGIVRRVGLLNETKVRLDDAYVEPLETLTLLGYLEYRMQRPRDWNACYDDTNAGELAGYLRSEAIGQAK